MMSKAPLCAVLMKFDLHVSLGGKVRFLHLALLVSHLPVFELLRRMVASAWIKLDLRFSLAYFQGGFSYA